MSDIRADYKVQLLQLEFSRLDILLHRQVERLKAATPVGDATAAPRRFGIPDEEVYALLQRTYDEPPAALETDAIYVEALEQIDRRITIGASQVEAQSQSARLLRLVTELGLDNLAKDILIISLAPAFDARYDRLYAYLQDDLTRRWPSLNLVLDLLSGAGLSRSEVMACFTADAPLWRHQLLNYVHTPGETQPSLLTQMLYPADEIARWLWSGIYQPAPMLKSHVTYTQAPRSDAELLSAQQRSELAACAAGNGVVVMHGIDMAGQTAAAQALAVLSGLPLLTLDMASVTQAGLSPMDAVRLLLRDARLIGAVPQIIGWDSCLVDTSPPPTVFTALLAHPGLVVIASRDRWLPHHEGRRRRLRWLSFDSPNHAQRIRLLEHFLHPILGDDRIATDDLDLKQVAQQFQLTTQQVQDTVNSAVDLAIQEDVPLSNQHLYAAARLHSAARLTAMAQKVAPRYAWDDLVLPAEQVAMLREMVNTVRQRVRVLDDWGAGQKLVSSAGITALFVGSPGTGKTMAAQVMAGELGLDLYKIDLSGLVSKYIGETEKNLERLFSEADRSNAILFFDEADAIFGKRSEVKDARDRYANIEISYLLQRMETYTGITILATNLGANLDEAFTRRLQFRVSFPDPDVEQRQRLWQSLMPAGVPRAANLDFTWLAQRFNLSGGNIRNIIVAAAYLAAGDGQMVTMSHILHATRREIQKIGRMINEKDFTAGRG